MSPIRVQKKQQQIFLIGPSGVGKTAIGRGLANKLGYQFYDVERMVETKAGVEISWILDVEGEAGVLKREKQILNELANKKQIVVATRSTNVKSRLACQALVDQGFVVYLHADLSERQARLAKRPFAQAIDLSRSDEKQLYESIADDRVDTDRLSPKAIVETLSRRLLS